MCTFYERIIELSAEKGISGSRVCLDLGLSKSTLSDIKSGRKKGVSAETAQKFADYFGVTVGYLLGKEEREIAPAESSERSLSDEDIKFALFRGREGITDAMYEEVLNFAEYVARREEEKKRKD